MAKVEYKSLPDSNLERRRNISFDFKYDDISVPNNVLEFAKGKKYYIHTYGCQANYRDEEIMAGLLEKAGFCKGNDEKLVVLVTDKSLVDTLPAFIEEKTHLFHQNIEVQLVDAILRNEAGKVINQ